MTSTWRLAETLDDSYLGKGTSGEIELRADTPRCRKESFLEGYVNVWIEDMARKVVQQGLEDGHLDSIWRILAWRELFGRMVLTEMRGGWSVDGSQGFGFAQTIHRARGLATSASLPFALSAALVLIFRYTNNG